MSRTDAPISAAKNTPLTETGRIQSESAHQPLANNIDSPGSGEKGKAMQYIRNNQEVSRSEFWGLLKVDLTDPETGKLIKWDYDDAKRMLAQEKEIEAGQHYRTMSTYKISTQSDGLQGQ
jgi:hypothetical protein